jgi:predicted Zn-ribbon and HTH transcriptional regulator
MVDFNIARQQLYDEILELESMKNDSDDKAKELLGVVAECKSQCGFDDECLEICSDRYFSNFS